MPDETVTVPESASANGSPAAQTVGIAGFGSYLPEKEVGVDFFREPGEEDPMANSPLFKAPDVRRHVAPDERASQMIERAARPMFERLGIEPEGNVDLLITNVLLPDVGITGSGAETAELLGCKPEWIIDLHNGGCGSFPYMLKVAQAIVGSGAARNALLCCAQNAAGQVFSQPEARKQQHAVVAGDGCGVAYVLPGKGPQVLAVEAHNDPSSARDMDLVRTDGGKYWQPGAGELNIAFDASKLKELLDRGNGIVPKVVSGVCERIGVATSDVDVLITNQPNRMFLRNWREAIQPKRHLDTFDSYGNLYGAGIPVTLAHAAAAGEIHEGDLVVLAGFAHAGDFAAAAALRWA